MKNRKLIFVLQIVLIASLFLSACGAPATAPAATEAPVAAPAATEAPAAAPAATEAPTAVVPAKLVVLNLSTIMNATTIIF